MKAGRSKFWYWWRGDVEMTKCAMTTIAIAWRRLVEMNQNRHRLFVIQNRQSRRPAASRAVNVAVKY